MKIAFVGDIHGRVFHTLAALTMWQLREKQKLDLIIQVGDLGAFPEPTEEMRNLRFVQEDETELDFSKYIQAKGQLLESIMYIKQKHLDKIHFIRGNHEDFHFLNSLTSESNVFKADPYDLFQYVADGTILNFHGMSFAFLGGIEGGKNGEQIDPHALKELSQTLPPRTIDVLVTHDAPYGIATGFDGNIQGSLLITELIERIQPKFLISGHYHHMNGPRNFGYTTYLGLNILVPPLRKDKLRKVQPGSIAILDSMKGTLDFVQDEWLFEIRKGFDFISFVNELKTGV